MPRMVLGSVVLTAGCSVGATQEWGLHTPDAIPRVTRLSTQIPTLSQSGPIYAEGELVVAERPSGVAVRSASVLGGYRFRLSLPDRDKTPMTIALLGRAGVGKPAIAPASHTTWVPLGSHVELTFPLTPPIDETDERVDFVYTKLETVIALDGSLFLQHEPFDVAGGVGLRFTLGTEVAPPLKHWFHAFF